MRTLFSGPPAVPVEVLASSGPAEEPESVRAARGCGRVEERRLHFERGGSQPQADHVQLLPAGGRLHRPRLWGQRGSGIPQQYRHK